MHVRWVKPQPARLPATDRRQFPPGCQRIIVGAAAGGGADINARLIGQWLSERLGRQFIIENRPGAGGTIAVDSVVRSPPDGYTLLLTFSSDAYNESLYNNLKFNYIRDIAPVAGIIRVLGVMVVHPSFPA
jgi:tripartite-type tricarboxylate transporter receptor subunit TctC